MSNSRERAAGRPRMHLARSVTMLLIGLFASTPELHAGGIGEGPSHHTGNAAAAPADDWSAPIDRAALADEVREQLSFAWDAYKQYAWGEDELRPLTKTGTNWYGASFLITPVDSLDSLQLLGLTAEAGKARDYVATHLSFNRNVYVSVFELTIRLLGGLESAYQLSGDSRLLALAVDLGNRLLPAFDSPTGMPYGDVNLATGAVRRPVTNPAEVGTSIVEMGTLSHLTGDPRYEQVSMRAIEALYARRSSVGLVGLGIDVRDGSWTNRTSSIGGGIDSYYEYLVKCARLFDDSRCAAMARTSLDAVNRYLPETTGGALWYGHADMDSGARTQPLFGALDAYYPAVLVLSGNVPAAERLEDSAFAMWRKNGIEPELYDYRTQRAVDLHYYLRPEIMESAYYLRRITDNDTYLRMARTFLRDLEAYCKTDSGYAELANVETKEKMNLQPSYFLAETLKYLYLTFAPDTALDFDSVTFNTEAHPVRASR